MWQSYDFPDTIVKTNFGRNNQINASEIQPSGQFPVIDQGQAAIAGFTDEASKVIKDDLPLVIFGDHTRCFKYVDFPFVIGADGTKVLKPNTELFDPKFYYYALLGLDIQNRGYNRHFTLLKEKKVPRPEIDEQRRIARVLSKVQNAIVQQERLITLTIELKRALMHQLFTEGLHGEKQKQTEIGLIPKSWDVVELEQVSEKPQYGFTESAQDTGTIQYLRITDIQEFGVNWEKVPFCDCPENLIEKYLLKNGDLVFARIGATTGKSYVIHEPPKAVFASYLIRIRPYQEILDSGFLSFFCQTEIYWHQIDAHKGNNLKGGVNSGILQKLLLPFPKVDEQQKISNIFNTLDNKIAIAQKRRLIYAELFRTLLHQLMTAQIRVNELAL